MIPKCKITIEGKETELRFGKIAFSVIYERMQKPMSNESIAGYLVVYGGLHDSYFVKERDIDFTFEQVCDWVDNADEAALQTIKDTFEQTAQYKQGLSILASNQQEPVKAKSSPKNKAVKNQ